MKYQYILIILFLFVGCTKEEKQNLPKKKEAIESAKQKQIGNNNDEKLHIEDIKVGTGDVIVEGKTIVVHYVGTLEDGKKFDSSRDRKRPYEFILGVSKVIDGWTMGLVGMKVGGKRKLTISPELGYGDRGVPGAIPPNATLIFEIELLKVK